MEGIQKKVRSPFFYGGHFGVHRVGEVTMYIIKTACFAAPARTVTDDFTWVFLSFRLNNAIRANLGE
jgi:hypothetical protein